MTAFVVICIVATTVFISVIALIALKEIERILDDKKRKFDTIERDYQEQLDRLRRLYEDLKGGDVE